MSDMEKLAVRCLPEDTRMALEASESGSDTAIRLVRRNLTQLPALAKALYNSTADAIDADDGLRALHVDLAPGLELYGALVTHGVNPRKRSWARLLTERYPSLRELRWTPWRRLMHIVGMDGLLGTEDAVGGEGTDEEMEEKVLAIRLRAIILCDLHHKKFRDACKILSGRHRGCRKPILYTIYIPIS